VRSHAKAPTAGSTQRQAKSLGRTRFAPTAVLAVAIVSLLAFAATPASASLQRSHESSFGSFGGENPQALAVDQSNGDIYAIDTAGDTVLRFDSSGAAKNFTAGPGAGTNALPGLNFEEFASLAEVAVDNSGGPSDGNIYVTQSTSAQVKVFASDGEPLGSLNGSGTPNGGFGEDCGVAVDQANGDVYIASYENRVWRYSPSGATVVEGDYSGGIATSINPCQLALASGSIYVHNWKETAPIGTGPLKKYATSEFATGAPPSPPSTQLAAKATAVATDPSNGDVYVDEGNKISVFSSSGTSLYSFGSGDFGASAGVAVRVGGSAYVGDAGANEIDVYGTTLEPGSRANLFSFGSFSGQNPQALTVDQSNGDIYAIDTAGDRVLRFNSSGLPKDFTAGPDAGTNALSGFSFEEFPSLVQVAVDNSGGSSDGNIYVTQSNAGVVKVFSSDGEPLGTLNGSGTPNGAFGEACGVAVDQANGDVYIASYENHVWRYSPSGATVVEGDYSGGIATSINPCQLAVASGSIYVHNWKESAPIGTGPLKKYATSEFATGAPPSPPSTQLADKVSAVATDLANGDVYVDEGDKVSVFDSSGTSLYSFGSGDFGSVSAGIAVKGGGNVYVSDPTNHQVDVYGPFSAPPPLLETKAASDVKHTKATLHGHLDPNDSLPITGCVFEWGTDTSYGEAPISCAEGSSFTQAADVSAELTGLTPGTTYHFRLHLTTGAGGFDGEDRSFETTPPSSVPEATTGEGTILSASSSELKGSVDPNANPLTDCHFEYVTDLALQATGFTDLSSGGSLPCDQAPGSIPADFEDHEVSATATGLDPEQVYRFRLVAENANGPGAGADALVPGPPLVETTGSPTRTTTTARLDSRVSSHGASTSYHFEYVTDSQFQASGFAGAASTPDTPLAVNEVQQVTVRESTVNGPGQQFRLSFGGYTTPDLSIDATAEQVQAALRALPSIGSPNVRVTLALNGFARLYTVTFQGAMADADIEQLGVSKGAIPPDDVLVETLVPGGPGDRVSFVSAAVGNLQPATAYRYRVVADNGTPGGPVFGADMTLATRVSDAPLSHGPFPGPPGSDRAWEQVNAPDTGGNRVFNTFAFSDDGDRAVYALSGGNPGSEVGSFDNQLFAERTANGWESSLIYPTRAQALGNTWKPPAGRSDLSRLVAVNLDNTGNGSADAWGLSPGSPVQHVFGAPSAAFGDFAPVSDDASRIIALLRGSFDADHPVTSPPLGGGQNLYDVSSGTPHLVSLLPGGSVPSCGVVNPIQPLRVMHWVSADGSHVFFLSRGSGSCNAAEQLYVRDLETETTSQISSGSVATFIRSTADAAFFTTKSSLVPGDEGGNDVYRYGLGDESLDCLTCFPGITADVDSVEGQSSGDPASFIGVSDDGSRLYFQSPHRLLPGAGSGIYRVEVASGALAYVARTGGGNAGSQPRAGNAISSDGSVFVFRSAAPGLDSLNGPQNGATVQYYRYDDDDRSLVCVSCPADGSLPRGRVITRLSYSRAEIGPNLGPLSSAGDLAFSTPTPLVSADQNTARPGQFAGEGEDLYEWRDGRLLLVSDGLTPSQVDSGGTSGDPAVAGITPSGRDIFFVQRAQLTPDAIDASQRLYDARIGGGFDFPTPPPPCPLEACQGTPRGVPEESRPGSADYSGAGNVASHPARCRKGKVRRRGRCVAKHHKQRAKRAQHRANHDRRVSR
jgi:sugar lactone lactonase YvrE